MSDGDGGRPQTWVKRTNLGDGAWQVRCSLCGKRFTRTFRPDRNDDVGAAVSAYVGEHLESVEHAAAVEAYREVPQSDLTKEELLLRAIFGEVAEDQRTPEQLRRSAARRAAAHAARSPR